jgi:hypothetical protein
VCVYVCVCVRMIYAKSNYTKWHIAEETKDKHLRHMVNARETNIVSKSKCFAIVISFTNEKALFFAQLCVHDCIVGQKCYEANNLINFLIALELFCFAFINKNNEEKIMLSVCWPFDLSELIIL